MEQDQRPALKTPGFRRATTAERSTIVVRWADGGEAEGVDLSDAGWEVEVGEKVGGQTSNLEQPSLPQRPARSRPQAHNTSPDGREINSI